MGDVDIGSDGVGTSDLERLSISSVRLKESESLEREKKGDSVKVVSGVLERVCKGSFDGVSRRVLVKGFVIVGGKG